MNDIEVVADLTLMDGRPLGIINQTASLSTGEIANDPQVRKLATQISGWVEHARSYPGSSEGMMNRSFYVAPKTPYDDMRAARRAVREDDVVAGLADATEAIAFDGGLKWEAENPDDADLFNQLSADLNLDAKIREMWREIFTVDQFVCAKLWDTKTYTVRGKTDRGNARKSRRQVFVPSRLVMLKPESVAPIGWGPLREDRLAWQSTSNEIGFYQSLINGSSEVSDPLMTQFFTGQYKPGVDEQVELAQWGVNIDQLLAMRADWVFRHTSTRPDWQKHPDVRMRAAFAQLDLKRQLVASDRAMLVGAANYILLIRKGSKEQPGTTEEVSNLKQGYQFLAKLPVIISDHRLDIEIVAPKLDFVLKKEAYEVLDQAIINRLLATFTRPSRSGSSSGGSSDIFADVLVAVIGSKRHMIKRALEQEVARAIVDHPRNEGIFDSRPSLVFTPRNVSLGTNQQVLSAMLTLRTQREMSRDTILEYLGLDESTEAARMEFEDKVYDKIFKTQIPFSATGTQQQTPQAQQNQTPNGTSEDPATAGRRGGRPAGGGTTKQSPSAQTAPKANSGTGNRYTPRGSGNTTSKSAEEAQHDREDQA